ncbi:hypothetical protein STRCI_006831 [Streptomyces cinnabarinus]|uniref:Uncharacterized protein n=1 Tax=Streptomyces cinnabarinus TaxID=67287 RepID=A0ABY7KP35_9ACTN|nr:hypothetical protein [Streptomyces cinnabarinus]WAZ25340.1 hypothetical protein STRCI_006831 [Streptomyces cinnabarinus]
MRDNSRSEQAVGFLLGLIEVETAARVRARTGLPAAEAPEASVRRLQRAWRGRFLPASVVLWILENDNPVLNTVVFPHLEPQPGLRRAVVRGVPFGSGRTDPVRVDTILLSQEPEVPPSYGRLGLVGCLRAATTMNEGRAASSMVLTRADWATVGEADRERPLPGYARWSLSIRPDCPPSVRAGFGSHAKFTHRLRQAGILGGPAEFAFSHEPAVDVLEMLGMGRALFHERVREAEDALRPLVEEHLGEREEAWAVLAQLMETFHGNTRELVMTAGAIA